METSWTEERCAQLTELWLGGLSTKAIADKLGGTTHNAVIGKAQRLGLPKHPSFLKTGRTTESSVTRIKKVRKLVVHGKHRHVANVVLREPVVEIVDSDIPAWQRRNLLQLERHHCHYPVGEPKDLDFFYCGAPIQKDSLYCTGHHQRCYDLVSTQRVMARADGAQYFAFNKLF